MSLPHIRRKFVERFVVGPWLTGSLFQSGRYLLQAQTRSSGEYDLVVKGGRVVDPSQRLSDYRHVAIKGRRVASVAANIPATAKIP